MGMRKKSLLDAYRFPGLRPQPIIKGMFGDHLAYVILLKRRSKKVSAEPAVKRIMVSMISGPDMFVICLVVTIASILSSRCAAWIVSGVAQ